MSRSYKHTPIYQDQVGKRFGKSYANRVVRRYLSSDKVLQDGNSYKKLYESWNISDYSFRTTWMEYLSYYEYNEEDGLYYDRGYKYNTYTLKELYNNWASSFLRK